MKKAIKIVLIFVVLTLVLIGVGMYTSGILPTSLNLHDTYYNSEESVLHGYDIVSYFEGNATQGKFTYKLEHDGKTWLFSSDANRTDFTDNPANYQLACGAYCAFAVSKGLTAPSDPNIFHIEENILYLFSNEEVKTEFVSNLKQSTENLNQNWQ